IGISSEDLGMIFNPFEQTQTGRMAGGTGLGLSISRKFANLLGGNIEVKSSLGEGSCFTFDFHYEVGDESAVSKDIHYRNVVKIKNDLNIKVLIVDDRDNNRDILTRMLKPLGFDTREASDGFKALDYIYAWKPDIVLLDIVMPEMSGIDVIKKLRSSEEYKTLKIIVITASVLDDDKDNVLAIGADAFVRKPFKQNMILEEIRKLLDIDYIYEEEKIVVETKKDDFSEESIRILFDSLPKDFLEKFREKLVIGDINDINKLNEIIESYNKNIYLYFKSLIDEFDFNVLLSILNKVKG
ncbi:MAG TPA: response regulator, partial [Spirochaetota bacterium]|nr:response regulator [Spirochaetota bacterium]